jgi:hypothetical protein
MKTPNRLILGAAVLVGLGVSACSQMSEPGHTTDELHHASAAGASQHGHNAAAMQRHAAEAKQMEERLRTHLQQMRRLSAEQQHARMGEHVSAVGQMLSMMDRHMREMGMGAGHTHMGQMMGMSAAQHDQMMKEMQALRAEVEQMQTLPAAEVGRQMPAHLDRLERMLPMLQQCAGHAHHG